MNFLPGSSPLLSFVTVFPAQGGTTSCKWLSHSGDSNTFQAPHHCRYKADVCNILLVCASHPSFTGNIVAFGSEESEGGMQVLGACRGFSSALDPTPASVSQAERV